MHHEGPSYVFERGVQIRDEVGIVRSRGRSESRGRGTDFQCLEIVLAVASNLTASTPERGEDPQGKVVGSHSFPEASGFRC